MVPILANLCYFVVNLVSYCGKHNPLNAYATCSVMFCFVLFCFVLFCFVFFVFVFVFVFVCLVFFKFYFIGPDVNGILNT